MDTAKEKLNSALAKGAETSEYVKAYINYQIELKKIESSAKASQAVSSILQMAIIGFLAVAILFFSLFALAFYLSEQNILSLPMAFLSIGLGILFLLLLFLLLKKVMIQQPITNKITASLFKDGKPMHTESDLKHKIAELEQIIEASAKEIPETVKELNTKDFVPEKLVKVAENKVLQTASKAFSKSKKVPTALKVASSVVTGIIANLNQKK